MNNELLSFCWSLGKDIVAKKAEATYGSNFYKNLSKDLRAEKFMDMLFYNTHLHCYVVVEVKTQKFDAAHLGQLGLYVSAVNHILKKDGDNPTGGLLICKSKDDVVAQYLLETFSVPIGISEYEFSKLYPADFKSSLPTIEEIEKELSAEKNQNPL